VPGYRGHLGAACIPVVLLLWLFLSLGLGMREGLLSSLLCFLGAIAPDIDTRSRARQLFFTLLLGAWLFALFTRSWMIFLVVLVIAFFVLQQRHRRLFHRFWFWVLLAAFILCATWQTVPGHFFEVFILTSSFLIGVISHLYLDGCRLF